jgi:hypothetical protein
LIYGQNQFFKLCERFRGGRTNVRIALHHMLTKRDEDIQVPIVLLDNFEKRGLRNYPAFLTWMTSRNV